MHIQIESFMEDKSPKLLTRLTKEHSTTRLINMLEKWKNTLDKAGFVYAMFMDLLKSFDTRNHDLLSGKLEA